MAPLRTSKAYPDNNRKSFVPFDWRRVAIGALSGAVLGGAFLLVGLARVGLARFTGSQVTGITLADLRGIAFYVGGFAAAGGFVAVGAPLMRGRAASYLCFATGGIIVGLAIIAGGLAGGRRDLADWATGAIVGATMGCALAYGLLKRSD